MLNVKRVTLAATMGLVLVAGLGSTAMAGGPKQEKVDICHRAGDKFVQISVAQPAVSAHMRHGDTLPDEYGDCQ